MRELKFRGLTRSNKWVYGLISILADPTWLVKSDTYISNRAGMSFAYEIIPETAGQYTGHTDRNHIEIYEGDIISRTGTSTYKVEYSAAAAAFELVPIIARYPLYFHELNISECKIRGNIHQNPELLK